MWSTHFEHLLNEQDCERHKYDNDHWKSINDELSLLKQLADKSIDNTGVLRDTITVNEVANFVKLYQKIKRVDTTELRTRASNTEVMTYTSI